MRARPTGWRLASRLVGAACLLGALGLASYFAWLFWGTGLSTARAQQELRADIVQRIERSRSSFPELFATSSVEGGARSPSRRIPDVSIAHGKPLGIIEIPKIDLDMVVVEGIGDEDLKRGPGHYPGTPYPWEQRGPVAIAGHRTTYQRPFWSLDKLRQGDLIRLITEWGAFSYRVSRVFEVGPDDTWVLERADRPFLVLTTCSPRFSSARRLVVVAEP